VEMYFVFDDDKHLLYFDNIELLQNGGYFPVLSKWWLLPCSLVNSPLVLLQQLQS